MKLIILHLTCVASMAAAPALVAQNTDALPRAEEASIPEETGTSPPKNSPAAETPARKPAESVDDEILVAFKPGSAAADHDSARRSIGAGKIKEFARIGVQHWKLPAGLTVARAIELLSKNPNVRFAEPNFIVRKTDLAVPNDELRGDLWGLHNVGQNGGTPDADIDALEVWMDATAQGTGEVVVGVIDSGIDYNHPDLAGRFLPRTDGLPGCLGYDFVNNDPDAMDDNGHGTHVAGTIAANADDGLGGVIGVAGRNPGVKLVPLKFLSASGSGTTDAAISAILYAADLDIKITNNSWGGGEKSAALELAIQDSGALFVAAAGNNRSNTLHYPAGYSLPNVLAVAATDAHDGLAYFSNYGDWVHLGAPGANIVSTTPNDTYSRYNGTSMAAPHVAGAAAMLLSKSPQFTIGDLKATLLATGDAVPSLADGRTSSGKRLNLAAALGAAAYTPPDATPGAVQGLQAEEPTQTSLLLEWPVADGVAYLYDLRYRIGSPITPENWSAATPVYGEPAPPSAGSVLVQGLEPGITYHFALRVLGANGTASTLVTTQATTLPLGWKSSVVDAAGGVGDHRSMAFNLSGQPFIAYSDQTNNRVKVATRSGESSPWMMDTFGSGYGGVSLALIPNTPNTTGVGQPSVSWAAGKLYFATKATGVWAISTLEKSGVQGDTTSLAYSPDGTPVISYRNTSSSGGLKIAWRTGSTWKTQVVAPGAAARYSSLAFDSNGNLMIAYSDDPNADNTLDALKLAVGTNRTASGWNRTITTIRQGVAGYGVWAAIAFDSADTPYIVHRESGIIHFLRPSSSGLNGWTSEPVSTGLNFNLAIGKDGSGSERAYVAYTSGGKARLATSAPLNGSSAWNHTIFDVEGFAWTPSVKVAAGIPSIAYGVAGTVRLATEAPGYAGPSFVFVDDMESGPGGWTPEGNSHDLTAKTKPPGTSTDPNESGLWHQTPRRGTDAGHSPVTSWYYGLESQGNYDTGTRNWGRLISPPITLNGTAAELKVSQLALAEGARYENAEIQIREEGGSTWTTVFQRASRTNTSFITDRINLGSYLGKTIEIGFFLDTKDGNYNQFEGWYVDDVSVKVWPSP